MRCPVELKVMVDHEHEIERASIALAKPREAIGDEWSDPQTKLPLRKRILSVVWDSLDKSPEERAFIAKIDWWILSYCCVAYFVKYLDQTNVRFPFLPEPVPSKRKSLTTCR